MLFDTGAQGHVFDSTFKDNSAHERGGHISVTASAVVVHSKHSFVSWPLAKPLQLSTSEDGEKSLTVPFTVAGAQQFVYFTSGDSCETQTGQTDDIYQFERIRSVDECREAAFVLGLDNSTDVQSSVRSQRPGSELRCYVDVFRYAETSEVRFDDMYLHTETYDLQNCSTTRLCLCRRLRSVAKLSTGSDDSAARRTTFENGKSEKKGGIVACASSTSFTI